MNRLRDIVDHEGGMRGDPLFRRGVELLQGTPPTLVLPDTQARVWRAIRRASMPAPRRLWTLALRVAVAAAVALAAGTAGAVIADRWIAPQIDKMTDGARGTELPSRSKFRRRRATPPAPVEAAGLDTTVDPVVTAAAVARERTEVLDALVALRREHDPVRAGTLLARYLTAHPRGALREEALVLAIEAADARGDRAGGEQLAHAYQGEFPAGRFIAFARGHTH
jgi:hypothetical protein